MPVFWVGLPSIRGPKSTSDMLYLNDLYRTRAEKAGVTYIDVWDGFVDESGRFAVQGPDFEGQIRRLRVSDGVHFTKAGARKLAHYLEREMRRMMQRGTELVAPSGRAAGAGAERPAGRRDRASAGRPGGAADRLGHRQPGIAGRRAISPPTPIRAARRACWSRARRSIRRPAAATTSPGRAAASRLRHRSGGRHHHRSGAGRCRACAGDRRGDACRRRSGRCADVAAGSKKTTGRSAGQQQQRRAAAVQLGSGREPQTRDTTDFGGGWLRRASRFELGKLKST